MAELQLKHIEDNNLPDEEKQSVYCEAIEGCKNILNFSPYDVKIYVDQGKYYFYLNEFDCAIEACSKAILLQPDYFEAYKSRSYAFFNKKDYVNAIEDFDYTIQNSPHNAEVHLAHVFKGFAALHLQDWEKAKSGIEADKKRSVNLFRKMYESVSDFEQKYNVILPADIAEMLRPPQA